MKAKYYTVNHTRKTITVDDRYQSTWKDEIDLNFYAKAGYRIRHKNSRKFRLSKEKADHITKREILEVMKHDSDATEEFNRILNKKGFFSAKKYYYDWVKKNNICVTYVTTNKKEGLNEQK